MGANATVAVGDSDIDAFPASFQSLHLSISTFTLDDISHLPKTIAKLELHFEAATSFKAADLAPVLPELFSCTIISKDGYMTKRDTWYC